METHKEFKTESEYLRALEMLNAYQSEANKYLKENKTNCIPPEVYEKFPFRNEVTNELRSAIEHYDFLKNPPDTYFIYIDEKTSKATTWTGQELGRVVFLNTYRSNFGDKRISIHVHAINGKVYSGIYYKSAGDYARIKMMKHYKPFVYNTLRQYNIEMRDL